MKFVMYSYCAFETSGMGVFQSQTYQDGIVQNLHYVCAEQNKCIFELFFSLLLTNPLSALEEGVMNQTIVNMIMKLVKL